MAPRVSSRVSDIQVGIWNLEYPKYSMYQVFGAPSCLVFHIRFGVTWGSSFVEPRYVYVAELEISNSHVSY